MGTKCTSKKTWVDAKIKSDETIQKNKEHRISEYNLNPVKCKQCGKSFQYSDRFKKFCNRSCSASYNNRVKVNKCSGLEVKHCLICGIDISSDRHKKVVCSKKCAAEYKKQKSIEYWKNNFEKILELPRGIRNHIIEMNNCKCCLCGWDKINPYSGHYSLIVDHIDGNSENNAPNNLRVICPNCDSLSSTYMSLNRGNGRMARKLQRIRDANKIRFIRT